MTRVLLRPALALKTDRYRVYSVWETPKREKRLHPEDYHGGSSLLTNFSPILLYADLLEYAKRVALQGNSNKFVAYAPSGHLEGVYIAAQLGGSRVKVERIRWHLCSSFATKADDKTPLHKGVWTNVDTIYIDFPDVSGPIAPFSRGKAQGYTEGLQASRDRTSGDFGESKESWRESVPGDWLHPAFR